MPDLLPSPSQARCRAFLEPLAAEVQGAGAVQAATSVQHQPTTPAPAKPLEGSPPQASPAQPSSVAPASLQPSTVAPASPEPTSAEPTTAGPPPDAPCGVFVSFRTAEAEREAR